jgi:hypothetical protein
LYVATITLITTPFLAYGATFKSGQSYDLAPNTTLDDNLYAAGTSIGVAGTVNGDVFAAGNTINVSGPVDGVVIVAGQMINISGKTSGSVIIAGNGLSVSNYVGGDLAFRVRCNPNLQEGPLPIIPSGDSHYRSWGE